ncbi:MAG: sugar ABC transporter permease [Thermaceae bacterium]|nr:sugar ABC transporter permease [Thermaceae bacterium]
MASVTVSSPAARRRRVNEYAPTAILFLAPTVILLLVFVAWPILESLRLSFTHWTGLGKSQTYVGLSNWARLLQDGVFWQALGNNLVIAGLSIAVQLPVALGLAVLLDRGGRRLRLFKLAYFMPLLVSSVAIGFLFKYIYDPNFGLLNAVLNSVGLKALAKSWLGDPALALYAVLAVICWQFIPFYMLVFQAALAAIPSELHDAATIDGASDNQFFWRITLPMLRGTIRTSAVLSLIGSLRYFDLIYVLTGGGPSGSTELMATYMYKQAFASFNFGYGSTVAVALILMVLVISGLVLLLTRRFQTEV